ncbi:hypothetical protein HHL16_20665 [Pseudoflavitalea sp. G-6-1-2]|uniref:PA14 domain-containing protein n=1 Tax=Pseudoflavitalea sp. G-6-1-2 TaxID=2728841 RepID=UPI00146F5888|nr:PA14 domain-containing protein [Pseudoflavitalea sp. G-6-1-2]NML23304.1 hypothetical protein [Pseudoflavitalea sp. G-6-1-2]
MKSKLLLVFISGLLLYALTPVHGQSCPAQSDNQSVSPSGNVWYAYFYRDLNLTNYHARASIGNPAFDITLSGNYKPSPSTFTCPANGSNFSMRARLTHNFTGGTYDFKVGSSGGVKLYVDGILMIDEWLDQTYTVYTMPVLLTTGAHNLVVEYYGNKSTNRVSFAYSVSSCMSTIPTETYGQDTYWKAYYYDGKNFNTYMGEDWGSDGNSKIDKDWGGPTATIPTNACRPIAETFSVRFRLRKSFAAGWFLFTAGGDDGYRLSLDGGATWIIDKWADQAAFNMTSKAIKLTGGYINMVLEYYGNHGPNRVFFNYGSTLPVNLISFDGRNTGSGSTLSWTTSKESTEDRFVIERSTDGRQYNAIGEVKSTEAVAVPNGRRYSYNDRNAPSGSAFYRLKIIDKDGPEKYSAIVNINTKLSTSAKIYPTLLDQHKQLFIQSEKDHSQLQVVIRNIAGQQLLKKDLGSMARGQIATLPLQQTPLSRGTYVVHVFAGNELVLKQAIVMP